MTKTAPKEGYILPLWDNYYAYRSTAYAYMLRELVTEVENEDGNTYSFEDIRTSIIGYKSGDKSA